jgi:predicted nucleic acid-binding protein
MRLSALFADTSFFYALLDERDRDHEPALKLAEAVRRRQIPLLTTWEVVVETVTLLRMRHSYAAALVFLDEILPRLNVVHPDEAARARALQAFRKLSRDKEISLCDAISYVVVTEYPEFLPCLAFDEDFKKMGLTVFEELPEAPSG